MGIKNEAGISRFTGRVSVVFWVSGVGFRV